MQTKCRAQFALLLANNFQLNLTEIKTQTAPLKKHETTRSKSLFTSNIDTLKLTMSGEVYKTE